MTRKQGSMNRIYWRKQPETKTQHASGLMDGGQTHCRNDDRLHLSPSAVFRFYLPPPPLLPTFVQLAVDVLR